MTKRRWIISIIVVLVGIYVYSHRLTIFSSRNASNAVAVTVATATKENVTVTLQAIGQVQPFATVSVASQVDGQLIQTSFNDGDVVKQGQVLFQIDPRAYQAKLEQAQAQLMHDQAQLWSTQLLLGRYAPLLKKGYVSEQQYDTTKSDVEALQASIDADQAAVDQAKLEVSYCTITAPISGRTGETLIDSGNIILAANKTPLVTINQIQPIYVSFTLPENQLPIVQQESAQHVVAVKAVVSKQIQEEGQLDFINNTVDNTTGTIQLRAIFQNDDKLLWPGQYVRVFIPTANIMQALVVPDAAIQQGQEGAYVYVLKSNKTVSYRPVVTGATVVQGTVITKGLSAGNKVVTAGQLRLDDGSKVTVQKTP